jgi:hypothetical protein
MGLLENVTKGPISTILLGLGVAMVAPSVLPSLASGLRPLAKTLVKGGVTLYDAAKEGIAEAGEQLNDLVAESRAEMANGSTSSHQEPDASGTRSTRARRRHSRA